MTRGSAIRLDAVMETLHGKQVRVVTKDGAPVAIGRFRVETAVIVEAGRRVELEFETGAMACRLRIPPSKIEGIRATWDGQRFIYTLPASGAVWRGLGGAMPVDEDTGGEL